MADTTVTAQHLDCMVFLASLPDESVDVITTDPAYSGMNEHLKLGRGRIVGTYGDAGEAGAKWFAEFSDDASSFHAFLSECHRVLKPDRHIYIMFDSYSLLTLGPVVRDVFDLKNVIVWDKVKIGMGHYFRRRHEFILFASKGRRKLSRKDIPDVWAIPRRSRAAYPTQKPVAIFTAMLEGSAEPGFVVCDPFVGSGSSAVAALAYGCSFTGSDISATAIEITQERCKEFLATGQDPLERATATHTH